MASSATSTNTKPVSNSADTTTKNAEVTSESLLHRLAGPSVGKSGLAQDQKAITAVIAEASVGSKFFLVTYNFIRFDFLEAYHEIEPERATQG